MIYKRDRGYKAGIKKRRELLVLLLRAEHKRVGVEMNQNCYACGDPAVGKRFNGKPVCEECLDELAKGVVKNQNINFFGGSRAKADEDSGPWGHNAIRCMEDCVE